MFVRKKINSSGSISVQILEKTNRTNKLIQTVGSSKDEIEIERLYKRAFEIIDQLKQQSRFNFYSNQDEFYLQFHLSWLFDFSLQFLVQSYHFYLLEHLVQMFHDHFS